MAGTNCLFFSLRQAFYLIHVTSETFSKGGPGQNKSFNMHCRCSYKVNKTTDHSALGDHWSHRAWHAGVRSFSTWLRTKCLFYEQNRSSMCHVIIKIAIAYPRPPIMGTNKQFETNEKIPIAYRCVQTVTGTKNRGFSKEAVNNRWCPILRIRRRQRHWWKPKKT